MAKILSVKLDCSGIKLQVNVDYGGHASPLSLFAPALGRVAVHTNLPSGGLQISAIKVAAAAHLPFPEPIRQIFHKGWNTLPQFATKLLRRILSFY